MEIYRDLNFQKVILEGDAKVITMAVKSEDEVLTYYGHLVENIRKC